MYSESDIEAAVAAGAISREAAAALRAHAAANRATPAVDEEDVRLVTSFNDIFVTIASILVMGAVFGIGFTVAPSVGFAATTATAWGLAEYFTRKRQMALPSIILLGGFVFALFGCVLTIFFGGENGELIADVAHGAVSVRAFAAATAFAALVAGAGAWAHWRRFRVPITVAAGATTLAVLVVALTKAAFPAIHDETLWIVLLCGFGIFALAMWWDMSDRTRTSRRSDVAFWLHLASAPLITHPFFYLSGLLSDEATPLEAVTVLLLYFAFGFVALAIDRRALLVSALAYVLYALNAIFTRFGAVNLNFALTALVIGSGLLMLSALWHRARSGVVGWLPPKLQDRLPVLR